MEEKSISKIKLKLLSHLQDDIYCQLKASPIHGIGVFAIRTIPEGVNPMRLLKKHREIRLPLNELADLPPGVMEQIKRFCFYDEDGVLISTLGLNTMSFLFYVNHSKNPNLKLLDDGSARAITQIEAGDELTIDYDKEFGEDHDFSDQQS